MAPARPSYNMQHVAISVLHPSAPSPTQSSPLSSLPLSPLPLAPSCKAHRLGGRWNMQHRCEQQSNKRRESTQDVLAEPRQLRKPFFAFVSVKAPHIQDGPGWPVPYPAPWCGCALWSPQPAPPVRPPRSAASTGCECGSVVCACRAVPGPALPCRACEPVRAVLSHMTRRDAPVRRDATTVDGTAYADGARHGRSVTAGRTAGTTTRRSSRTCVLRARPTGTSRVRTTTG